MLADRTLQNHWTHPQVKSWKVSSLGLKGSTALTLNSSDLACKALDDLLTTRIFSTEKEPWVEKVLITRLWITTSSLDTENVLSSLRLIFDTVAANVKESLSAHATHAAQTVSYAKPE